jgi:hypothetical protein
MMVGTKDPEPPNATPGDRSNQATPQKKLEKREKNTPTSRVFGIFAKKNPHGMCGVKTPHIPCFWEFLRKRPPHIPLWGNFCKKDPPHPLVGEFLRKRPTLGYR